MDLQLNPDLESRLALRAAQQCLPLNEVVQGMLASCLQEEDRLRAAVERGESALARGEFLPHEQVGERLHRFF
ncbi:hypothetical protein ACOBR2_06895 [Telmatobacter bradus]|uniref:hypothetical protein n=1 Tax=Telmatobacter bradus TaxID=474953 RepID=UPI003B43A3AA